jgi:hypothetical protein
MKQREQVTGFQMTKGWFIAFELLIILHSVAAGYMIRMLVE